MPSNKKKITELEYFVETTRESKNALGYRVRNKVTVKLNYNINKLDSFQRLIHYLIDLLIIKSISYLIILIKNDTTFNHFSINDLLFTNQGSLLFFTFIIYYFLLELFFQKTIGKFFTKSIVINEYGHKVDLIPMIFRTLGRLVPFDGLAIFLGYRALHDLASSTFVVSKEELKIIINLQKYGLNKM